MDPFVSTESIARSILLLRGHRVLLDADLASLYGVPTKALKQAVRRNRARFPDDFMFQLTADEARFLRSQFVTLDAGPAVGSADARGRHAKFPPFAFTEQGVAMLASVLHSPRAIQVNIAIMRTFVHLRRLLAEHVELARKLEELERAVATHDSRIREIFAALRALMSPPDKSAARPPIGFRPPDGPDATPHC